MVTVTLPLGTLMVCGAWPLTSTTTLLIFLFAFECLPLPFGVKMVESYSMVTEPPLTTIGGSVWLAMFRFSLGVEDCGAARQRAAAPATGTPSSLRSHCMSGREK